MASSLSRLVSTFHHLHAPVFHICLLIMNSGGVYTPRIQNNECRYYFDLFLESSVRAGERERYIRTSTNATQTVNTCSSQIPLMHDVIGSRNVSTSWKVGYILERTAVRRLKHLAGVSSVLERCFYLLKKHTHSYSVPNNCYPDAMGRLSPRDSASCLLPDHNYAINSVCGRSDVNIIHQKKGREKNKIKRRSTERESSEGRASSRTPRK